MRQHLVEALRRREHARKLAERRLSGSLLPNARLGEEVGRTQQRAAEQPAQHLVEGYIEAIEKRGVLGEGALISNLRLPDARTVGVEWDAALAAFGGNCDQFVPGDQRPAQGPQRDLDARHVEALADGRQIHEGGLPKGWPEGDGV